MPSTDLCQAVLVKLRATSSVTTAFGDTWNPSTSTGTAKLFADYAGPADDPYAVIMEVGERYDWMTRTTSKTIANYLAEGQLQIWIYQDDRQAARALGVLVAAALNDQEATITWTGSTLMAIRMSQAAFIPTRNIGPNVPVNFNRVLTFDYTYESSITEP